MDQHESSWPEKFVNPRIGLSIDKDSHLSIFSKRKPEKKFLVTYIPIRLDSFSAFVEKRI